LVQQNPARTFWERLLPHYRRRDWDRCLRELRPVLDADEDALGPRLLCAGLHLAAAQPVLALLQYETLLPLAVGQADFFAAIAVQRRLDHLHPASVTHPKRYEVLRKWFISLGRNRRVLPGERPGELSESALLDLDSAEFTHVMERCTLEGLEPDPRTLRDGLDSCRVVLYGRATWSLGLGEQVTLLEGIAEPGQVIAVDPGMNSGAVLSITAELPSEMLVFDAETMARLRGAPGPAARPAGARARPASPAPRDSAAADAEAAPPPSPRVEAARVVAPRVGPASRSARPSPDPRFEPALASHSPSERRRENRVAISLASGVARLGLIDTRVSPLSGRMTQLSAERLELVFVRSELRHLRTRLEGSCLGLQFNLGPDQPVLPCTGRVRWTSTLGSGPETNELKLEVEILPLRSADRDRLNEAGRRFVPGDPGGPMERAA